MSARHVTHTKAPLAVGSPDSISTPCPAVSRPHNGTGSLDAPRGCRLPCIRESRQHIARSATARLACGRRRKAGRRYGRRGRSPSYRHRVAARDRGQPGEPLAARLDRVWRKSTGGSASLALWKATSIGPRPAGDFTFSQLLKKSAQVSENGLVRMTGNARRCHSSTMGRSVAGSALARDGIAFRERHRSNSLRERCPSASGSVATTES